MASQVRPVTLNASKAGMTRLRSKGGASTDTLWELTNGFVNASKCPQQRPGSTFKKSYGANGDTAGLPKGLCSFAGKLHTFCHRHFTLTDSTYVVDVLKHPTSSTATIVTIWFAKPFMGLLYVAAEFSDGFIGHYWLQAPNKWKANTQYFDHDLVQPTVTNGLYYEAQRTINPPSWTALLQYKGDPSIIGGVNADRVQPSVYNGSYFIVGNIYGPGASLNPPIARSGSVEPNWAAAGLHNRSVTLEHSTGAALPTPAAGPDPPTSVPPSARDGGRYSNRAGQPAPP